MFSARAAVLQGPITRDIFYINQGIMVIPVRQKYWRVTIVTVQVNPTSRRIALSIGASSITFVFRCRSPPMLSFGADRGMGAGGPVSLTLWAKSGLLVHYVFRRHSLRGIVEPAIGLLCRPHAAAPHARARAYVCVAAAAARGRVFQRPNLAALIGSGRPFVCAPSSRH